MEERSETTDVEDLKKEDPNEGNEMQFHVGDWDHRFPWSFR